MDNAALDNKRVLVRVEFNSTWMLMETFWTIEEERN
jgi:hypothetical protein